MWTLFTIPDGLSLYLIMKINSICENRDYKKVYSRGKTIVTPCVVIYIFRNKQSNLRLGITASKKVGNAVKRNRARRVLKEGVVELLDLLPTCYDVVLVARAKTPFVKSTFIKKILLSNFKKIGLIEWKKYLYIL